MSRKTCCWVSAMLAALMLSGCQSMNLLPFSGDESVAAEPGTLAELQPAAVSPLAAASGAVGLEDVISGYERLLPLLEDPEQIIRVQHRLADLRFQQAENRMTEQAVDELDVAIDAYQRLLELYPDRETNDRILYQLARTYELRGDTDAYLATLDRLVTEFPDSEFRVESEFRRGEVLFSNYDYAGAEKAFDAVIQADADAPGRETFLTNAWYMKGWSQFKQGDYEPALISYVSVLDIVLPGGERVQNVDGAQRTMVEDLFRVMGLSFSYLGGAESVAALFERTGRKPWEILVYDRYSELLLEKELYSDAIEVYEQYIEIYPLSRWAPRYHMNIIATLQVAGFTASIPERKAEFVDTYGITGDYWARAEGEAFEYIFQQLEELLPELANRHYVLAQKSDRRPKAEEEEYRRAARYYGEFVETFPSHEGAPELLFLLAETQLELRQWRQAIQAFEQVAYDYGSHAQAAEAAYASILVWRSYAETWTDLGQAEVDALGKEQQQNRVRFVSAFPEDERALNVLYIATRHEFEQQDYRSVIEQTGKILAWQAAPDVSLMTEAFLLKAHSLYALEDYPQAEVAYQEALLIMPPQDNRHSGVIENLAASVYRQAEAHLAAREKPEAVDEFLRVGLAAPSSSVRPNAEYDAANTLMELTEWQRAIDVMTEFRQNYPQHPMIDTLPAKMALAYRETEQWEAAADELQTLFDLAETDEDKRETLLIAADLYDRAGSREKAIASYRLYANSYPAPLDTWMENANRLAELYEEADDPLKRRFWLARQMEAVDRNPDQADDRMRYLAAEASAVLATDVLTRYNGIALTLPLEKTMAAKIGALETAAQAWQRTANYGISRFSTEAGYRIADIYARLGRDLMDAERPEGLSELEAMQYDLLLEEQAFPFEENAIDIHEQNASRSWNGIYDEWVQESFGALKRLMPGRYDKPEVTAEVVDELD
ncbi:tetratricopeptide repeat protein [Marinobacter sp.]|uniref:tetratricopeptide repeat protein n=1 Tax=Marinobacter sp. TaxID=50741 RepID=UPI00384F33E9